MRKESIGLITLHSLHNFGSKLQTYALYKVMVDLGFDVEVINYVPASIADNKRSWELYSDNPEYERERKLYAEVINKRRVLFDKFSENFNLGLTLYYTDEEIELNPPKYDIYVSGSDQIWNANFRIASRAYFLGFADSTRKYAFGPSIGRCKADKLNEYIELIQRYQRIYIREDSGADYLKHILGGDERVGSMLDPTLLFSAVEWNEFVGTERIVKGEYIACYATSEEQFKEMFPILQHLYDQIKLKVVLFGMMVPREEEWIENLIAIGPCEWVRLIRDAKFVFTQSFHGTIFSLNYNVPFMTWNDRLENPRKEGILRKVGLENRIVHDLDEAVAMERLFDMDFKASNAIIEHERIVAKERIKSCLLAE